MKKGIKLFITLMLMSTIFTITSFAAGWQWIDYDKDGYEECYYVLDNGYILANGTTPDGYKVDKNGAWTDDRGTVQKRKAINPATPILPNTPANPVSPVSPSNPGTVVYNYGGVVVKYKSSNINSLFGPEFYFTIENNTTGPVYVDLQECYIDNTKYGVYDDGTLNSRTSKDFTIKVSNYELKYAKQAITSAKTISFTLILRDDVGNYLTPNITVKIK